MSLLKIQKNVGFLGSHWLLHPVTVTCNLIRHYIPGVIYSQTVFLCPGEVYLHKSHIPNSFHIMCHFQPEPMGKYCLTTATVVSSSSRQSPIAHAMVGYWRHNPLTSIPVFKTW